jgi:hypothetical protein
MSTTIVNSINPFIGCSIRSWQKSSKTDPRESDSSVRREYLIQLLSTNNDGYVSEASASTLMSIFSRED